jgi:hypothetical protein
MKALTDAFTQLMRALHPNPGEPTRLPESSPERDSPDGSELFGFPDGNGDCGIYTPRPSMLRAPLDKLSTTLKKASRLSKDVPWDEVDLWRQWKADAATKAPDSDRRRAKDLTAMVERLSPLVRLMQKGSQEPITVKEFAFVAEACVASAVRYAADEMRVMALCQKYSLDPKRYAESLRQTLELYPGDLRAQTLEAQRLQQSANMEKALATRSYSGGSGGSNNGGKSNPHPSGGRDNRPGFRRSTHPNSNNNNNKNYKAAGGEQPAARDV